MRPRRKQAHLDIIKHIQRGRARSVGGLEAAREDLAAQQSAESVSDQSITSSLREYRLIRQLEEQDPELFAFAVESLQAEREEL